MATNSHTIQLSEPVFRRLEKMAGAARISVDTFADKTLQHSLPPALDRVPVRFRSDLYPLISMSDDMLWQIARSELDEDKLAHYETLLDENAVRDLVDSEQSQLDILREEADLMMFRRSFAYLLLKQRGYNVPDLDE